MSIIGGILACMGLSAKSASSYAPLSEKENSGQRFKDEQELADYIVETLLVIEKPSKDLALRLRDEVHSYGFFDKKVIARRILDGVIKAIQTGAIVEGALKSALDHATEEATKFAKENPELTAVIVTLIALAILEMLFPWAIGLLGFMEDGVVERSFAAAWQRELGDVKAGSIFAWLQRVAMTWNK